jgi:spermidine synthase
MKDFIYSEMMIHIPLCTHKEPKNILIISANADALTQEVKKHDSIDFKAITSIEAIRDEEDASYDVVICEIESDAALSAHINRVLKNDGLLVTSHEDLDNIEINKSFMQILGNYYKIIMPYNIGNGTTALLASKEYHPTADIILQRSDMLDNNSYYNCDIHIASFAMPNYIRKEYLGIIKN